jgi:hypothetical protein
MKDWIQERYSDRLWGYNKLREAIIAAWNAVPEAYLNQLLEEMPAKCGVRSERCFQKGAFKKVLSAFESWQEATIVICM